MKKLLLAATLLLSSTAHADDNDEPEQQASFVNKVHARCAIWAKMAQYDDTVARRHIFEAVNGGVKGAAFREQAAWARGYTEGRASAVEPYDLILEAKDIYNIICLTIEEDTPAT